MYNGKTFMVLPAAKPSQESKKYQAGIDRKQKQKNPGRRTSGGADCCWLPTQDYVHTMLLLLRLLKRVFS